MTKRIKAKIIVLFCIVILIVVVSLCLRLLGPPYDPIPLSVRQTVSFRIYYPDQSKLPIGYSLDIKSISASNQAVVYVIRSNSGQKLNVSIQARPSAAQLIYFDNSIIALHTQINTNIGKALIGAINSQAVLSLPVGGSWILITAPGSFNQSTLQRVIDTFKST